MTERRSSNFVTASNNSTALCQDTQASSRSAFRDISTNTREEKSESDLKLQRKGAIKRISEKAIERKDQVTSNDENQKNKENGGKINLGRKPKLSLRRRRIPDENIFSYCLYSPEYCDYNLKLLLDREQEELIPKSILELEIDDKPRILVIDWLISLHHTLGLFDITLYNTVKLFDRIIIKMRYNRSHYLLASVVSLWVASKIYDKAIHLDLLAKVSDLNPQEILAAEKLFLFELDFKCIQVEPETILFYFIQNENLTNNMFAIECSSFHLHLMFYLTYFASIPPSLLAAGALYLTLLKINIDVTHFLKFIGHNLLAENIFLDWILNINIELNVILKKVSHQIFGKFSKLTRNCVVSTV